MNKFQITNKVEIFLLNDNMQLLGFSCRKFNIAAETGSGALREAHGLPTRTVLGLDLFANYLGPT